MPSRTGAVDRSRTSGHVAGSGSRALSSTRKCAQACRVDWAESHWKESTTPLGASSSVPGRSDSGLLAAGPRGPAATVKSPGGRTAEDPDELKVEKTTRSEVGTGGVVDDLCHPGTGDRQRG